MRRLGKWQAFICILVILLVWANLYVLLPSIIEPYQGKPFSFTSSRELPLHNSKTCLVTLPPWQVSENNAILAQSATEISLSGVLTIRTGNARGALLCYRYETVPKQKEISFHTDSLSAAFKSVDRQTCQHFDIPPPHAFASVQI